MNHLLRRVIVVSFLAVLGLQSAVYANTLAGFNKRFRVIRDEQKRALRIIDRSLNTRLSFSRFSKTYYNWFISEAPSLSEGNQFTSAQSEIELRSLNRQLIQILDELKEFDLSGLITSNAYRKVNDFLTAEFKKLSTVGFRTVSNLENTTFFYQDKHYERIEESAKKEAQKYFPILAEERVVKYLIERYINFLKDSRSYHQGILLHYLINFSADKLGLSKDELGMAVSSIMEAEIKWHDVFSRRRLRKNWTTYGLKRLDEVMKESQKRMSKHHDLFSQTPFFVNPYFALTRTKRGEDVWVNAFFQNKALDNRPTISFDFTRPNLVYRQRRYYELLLFESARSDDSNLIKKYFTHLKFRRQMLKEGLLFGFYESKEDSEMKNIIIRQSLNPLETIFTIPL